MYVVLSRHRDNGWWTGLKSAWKGAGRESILPFSVSRFPLCLSAAYTHTQVQTRTHTHTPVHTPPPQTLALNLSSSSHHLCFCNRSLSSFPSHIMSPCSSRPFLYSPFFTFTVCFVLNPSSLFLSLLPRYSIVLLSLPLSSPSLSLSCFSSPLLFSACAVRERPLSDSHWARTMEWRRAP